LATTPTMRRAGLDEIHTAPTGGIPRTRYAYDQNGNTLVD